VVAAVGVFIVGIRLGSVMQPFVGVHSPKI
jgi:hypothetical protein